MVRPISPFEQDENTRLQTEYDPHAPAPRPKPSKKKSLTPRTDRVISRIRLVLRTLSFMLSGSIVGFVAYAVWLYRKTENDYERDQVTGAEVRVWPTNLKTQPTYTLLGISCAATLLNLIIIVASFNKTIRHVTNVGNLLTAVISGVCIILWISTGAYFKSDDLNTRMHMDIVSYVCAHRNNVTLRQGIGNTGAVCGGLRYAWWAVLLVASVEMLALATVGWGAVIAAKKGTYAKV